MTTALQTLRRAEEAGYRFSVVDGCLGYTGPRGLEITRDLLADLRLHQREIAIYVRVDAYNRNPPRCELCGLVLSIVAVAILCGRCVALHPLVREAIRLGARLLPEDENDPKFDRWRAINKELAAGPRSRASLSSRARGTMT